MTTSWGLGIPGSGRGRRRAALKRDASAWALLGALALALIVGGCGVLGPGEAPTYGFYVWNYSTNQYVVRVTYESGSANAIVVPPRSDAHTLSPGLDSGGPRKAVVMDGQCATQVTTLQLSDDWAQIIIDESGHMTVANSIDPGTTVGLPLATPEALPSACA